MQPHKIVSHDEWVAARKAHLKNEKALTHLRDLVNEERRALPWEKVEKNYVFDTPPARRRSPSCSARTASSSSTTSCGAGSRPGLPELLLHGRPHRRPQPAPEDHDVSVVWCRARRSRNSRPIRSVMGWEFNVGVVLRQRLQLRLPCLVHRGGTRQGKVNYNYEMTEGFNELPGISVFARNDAGRFSTPIRAMRAAATSCSAPITISTSRPRAATRTRSWTG